MKTKKLEYISIAPVTLKLRKHNHSALGYKRITILAVGLAGNRVEGVVVDEGYSPTVYTGDAYWDLVDSYVGEHTEDPSSKSCFYCSDEAKALMKNSKAKKVTKKSKS